jgi:N12 class adenine-specific DNA methylase
MCCGAMEMKRLGLANKPMIIGLKANVHEIAMTFKTAYPNAKILYPGKEDFTPKNRVKIFNEIKNNSWDAVILTHDQFGMIPQSPEIQKQILERELESVYENIDVLKKQGKEINGTFTAKSSAIAKLYADNKVDVIIYTTEKSGMNFSEFWFNNCNTNSRYKQYKYHNKCAGKNVFR